MEIRSLIENLIAFKKNNLFKMSKNELNWLSKIFQFYENLDRNEKLFIKYLKVKIDQIPIKILNYLNFSKFENLYSDIVKNSPPFQNETYLDDIKENEKITSEKISALADNFNIQKGMYKVRNRTNNFVIKAEVNGIQGLYSNKWIIVDKEIEYILEQTKINSGTIKKSEINASIIKSINDKTLNNFYLFVRDAARNEKLYTFKGTFKVVTFNHQLKSIRLFKKEINDIQDDLRNTVEMNINESINNPFYEKFKIVEQKQRIGQKLFRELLLSKYPDRKCALCDVYSPEHLIANHIKPFRHCDVNEAIDPNNGLLLCPDHNHLMDRGYLTFSENGVVILSNSLNKNLISEFRLNSLLSKRYYFDKKTFEYINYHKDKVFLR
jgi:hypothetical protein